MKSSTKPTFVIVTLLLLAVLLGLIFLSYNNKAKQMAAENFYVDDDIHQSPADVGNVQYTPGTAGTGLGDFAASEPSGNAQPGRVNGISTSSAGVSNGAANGDGSPTPACFPRDRLSAEDLLPKDAANSRWAQQNPAVGGDVRDQNFLTAGYHIGIDTVGSSMKNPNLQLRSEPPIEMKPVSPWLQSTTTYGDINRRPLEIGQDY